MSGDRLNPDDFFTKKPDVLASRIKSQKEHIPNVADKDFQEHLDRMAGFLVGKIPMGGDSGAYPVSPPERNWTVIQNVLREIDGDKKNLRHHVNRIVWQSNPVEWQKDPNFYSAIGLLFAEMNGNEELQKRLTMETPQA